MFKRYLMLIALFLLASNSLYSYLELLTLEVGKQPATAYTYNGNYYVVCLGSQNFTGVYNPAIDEPPSIWQVSEFLVTTKINSTLALPLNSEKIMDLPYGTPGFPFRPYFSNDLMYIHIDGKIRVYDLTQRKIIDSIQYDQTVMGLDKYDDILYISTRVIPPGEYVAVDNYVVVYDLKNNIALDTIPAKSNVQMLKYAEGNKLYVLNEGFGSENDSYVTVYNTNKDESGNFSEIEAYSAGAIGNYFTFNEAKDRLYVVSNGSHKVIEYSLTSDASMDYLLPTSGYDGPREVVINYAFSLLRVSSYGGEFYEFEIGNPQPISTRPGNGKGEGMVWDKYNKFFILCNISNSDYSENDTLTILIDIIGSVRDISSIAKVYPNPSSDYVNISGISEVFENYSIFTISGNRIGEGRIENFGEELKIDFSRFSLQSGKYILHLEREGKTAALPITVVR